MLRERPTIVVGLSLLWHNQEMEKITILKFLFLGSMLLSTGAQSSWSVDTWKINDSRTVSASGSSNILSVACSITPLRRQLHLVFVPTEQFILVPAGFGSVLLIDNVEFDIKTKPANNSEEISFYDLKESDNELIDALMNGSKIRIEAAFGNKISIEEYDLTGSLSKIRRVTKECSPPPRRVVERKTHILPVKTVVPAKPVPVPPQQSKVSRRLEDQENLVKAAETRTLWYLNPDNIVEIEEDLSRFEDMLENPDSYK